MPSATRTLAATQTRIGPSGRLEPGSSGIATSKRATGAGAYQRILNAVLAIGVLCMAGAAGPLHAELIDDPLGDKTAADSAAGTAWSEDLAQPVRDSGDIAGDKDKPIDARPAPLPPVNDDSSALPARIRRTERRPAHSQTMDLAVPPGAAGPANADWTLAPEFKEAVRPLYEGLASSAIAEEMRELKAELGPIWGTSADYAATRDLAPDAGSSPPEPRSWEGPAAAPRSAAQVERDKVLASVMMAELIAEIKPWAVGLVGLYLFGYMVKLWLDYVRRMAARKAAHKAARSAKRGSRRSRRHRRPQAASGSPAPHSPVLEALPSEGPRGEPAADA